MAKKTQGSLALAGFNDIFNVGNQGEIISILPLSELFPPDFHPFQVNDDLPMQRLVRSVKQYGVREPGLARPREDGGYELLCGNRRKRACELAEMAAMPVIVREMSDDDAVIAMVDSNLEQREKLLLSEKAWAYRIKMEALNHNGVKADMDSVEVLMEQTGETKTQIYRLIRLTELIPDLLDKTDAKQLSFNPAVELSYLSRTEQAAVVDAMAKYEVKPSLSQAVRLKKMKQAETLTVQAIDNVFCECKKPPQGKTAETSPYAHFFPADYSPKQMEDVIAQLLQNWKINRAIEIS